MQHLEQLGHSHSTRAHLGSGNIVNMCHVLGHNLENLSNQQGYDTELCYIDLSLKINSRDVYRRFCRHRVSLEEQVRLL